MRSVTERFGRLVAERDGGWLCHYCGVPLIPQDKMAEVCTEDSEGAFVTPDGVEWAFCDHIVPRAKGGKNELANLVLTCHPCNSSKGARDYEAFIAQRGHV